MNISELEILSKEDSIAILLEDYEKNFQGNCISKDISLDEYIWYDNV